MTRPDSSDYCQLFLRDTPLLDVRAPIEFDRGAFPLATNIPLLDDQQREDIGKRYKDAGQDEAIQLGLRLATDEIREQRLQAWRAFCEANSRDISTVFVVVCAHAPRSSGWLIPV